MKLTLKQKAFADYYLETGNATESAIKAGYSKKTAKEIGCENLTKPSIKNYIDERMKAMNDKRIAKAEEVLEYLTRVLRGEETEEVVVVENTGDYTSQARTIEKKLSVKDRLKAAELLGKRYALFTEKVNVEGNVGVTIIDDIGDIDNVKDVDYIEADE